MWDWGFEKKNLRYRITDCRLRWNYFEEPNLILQPTRHRAIPVLVTVLICLALSLHVSGAQPRIVVKDLSAHFPGVSGAFVLCDSAGTECLKYNPEQCARRFSPASTFKILNSLIGLETGVIPDKNFVIPWDSVVRSMPEWNRDHDLQSAIKYSVVWYYQELARRVGEKRMLEFVEKAGYGNMDISGGIDRFWLGSSLSISADEQVNFLKRLLRGDLPFSRRSMDLVNGIIPSEIVDSCVVHGKTGLADQAGQAIGWYVGYVEKPGNTLFFALNMTATGPDDTPYQLVQRRKETALAILRELGVVRTQGIPTR